MAGGMIASCVSPHTPRMGIERNAPEFLRGVIAGSYALGEDIQALKPDLIVLQSTHWVTTFPWYATCHKIHEGHCVADEAPDMIPGQPYRRPGDPEFSGALIEAIKAEGILAGRNESPHYHWDYGTYVPLQYLDSMQTIPLVTLGVCLMSDFAECQRVGAVVRKVAERLGRRAVFVASTAFAHRLERGPDKWPPPEHRDADRRFIGLLREGKIAEAKAWFPAYAKDVVAEMGGRVLATMLGTLDEATTGYTGKTYGAYGQSSASGNMNVAVFPVH